MTNITLAAGRTAAGAAIAISGAAVPGMVQTAANAGTPASSGLTAANAPVLRVPGAPAGTGFGSSVAVSGNLMAVGAPGSVSCEGPECPSFPGSGRVYVYAHNAVGWHQAAVLRGSDSTKYDAFGDTVAISGQTVAVGAWSHGNESGRVYVFDRTGGGWRQVAELTGGGQPGDAFGAALALERSTLVVGAPGHDLFAGQVYVFGKSAGGWHQVAVLTENDARQQDHFGGSVAIADGRIAVTAVGATGGAVYVYDRSGPGWAPVTRLTGASTGSNRNPQIGTTLALSGNWLATGGTVKDGQQRWSGRVFLFRASGGTWRAAGLLSGTSDRAPDNGFGDAVTQSAGLLVASDPSYRGGRLYVFARTSGGWTEKASVADPAGALLGGQYGSPLPSDQFGYALASSGGTVMVGDPWTARLRGAVYVLPAR